MITLIPAGCAGIIGAVTASQDVNVAVPSTSEGGVATVTTSDFAGPLDPRQESRIEVIYYSKGPIQIGPGGDLRVQIQLLAGETVVEEEELYLARTDFEPVTAPIIPLVFAQGELDTRYAATITKRCTTCNPTAIFPDEFYSWRAVFTVDPEVKITGAIHFEYGLYLGPIVAP